MHTPEQQEARRALIMRLRAYAQTDACKAARRRWLVLGLASPLDADERAFLASTFKAKATS